MPKEKIIWKNKKAAELYHKEVSKKASGVIDEKYVKDYIASKKNIKVVSLGIGAGRELSWLNRSKNIKGILGVDYSQEMLDICRIVAKKYNTRISLTKDSLLSLKFFKELVRKETLSLIYICLINTLGNFTEKQREKILKNLRNLMKKKDRLILCLYKKPEDIKAKIFLPPQIKIKKNLGSRIKIGTLIEYCSLEMLWFPILEKYHRLPRFWYDDKNNNVTICVGKKKIFVSHRFSKEEIMEIAKKIKLKIEKLIAGKFMWVVILKV